MPETRTARDILNDLIEIHDRKSYYSGPCEVNGWAKCRDCHLAEAIHLIDKWVTEQEKVRGVGNV